MIARRCIMGAVLAALGGPAAAQYLPPDDTVRFSRYVAVGERPLPGYDAAGVRVGSFTLSPAIGAAATYTDNIFATERDRRGDAFVTITPSARLTSNWSDRSLNLSADGNFARYASRSSENLNAVNLSAYATQDFAGRLRVRALGRFRADRESRDSQNVFALTRRPVAFRDLVGAVGASKRFGSVQLAAEAGLQKSDFDNARLWTGETLDQEYRDGMIRSLRGRADIIQTASLSYFVQATGFSSSFSQRSSLGVRRGTDTIEILAGARFELPILARGEIGVGYIQSNFRDDRFRRFSGPAVNARVMLFPTALTTVTVNAVRNVNDAGTPESSTYVTLAGGVQVDHELLRSLILNAGVQVQRDRFNGADRRDSRVALNAGASYRLPRGWSLRVSSEGAARFRSFTRNRAMLGLELRI